MPSYKGHLAGGAAAFGIALYVITRTMMPSVPTMIEWLFLALAGALFPDIDTKSKGQKYFYFLLFFILTFLAYKRHFDVLIFLSLIAIIPILVRHRGIFHRLWFVIAVPALTSWIICILWFPQCSMIIFYDCLFFILGAVSHLWLDLGLRRVLRL